MQNHITGEVSMQESPEVEGHTELPKYKSHKEVYALKIKEVQRLTNLIIPEDDNYMAVPVGREYMQKHFPQAGGYYVIYADGYKSYSPADAFEKGYTKV